MRIYDDVAHDVCQRCVDHMVEAIDGTAAEKDPFPHFIVRGLLPDDIYRDMLELLPEEPLYEAFSYDKHSTDGVSNRLRFKLTDASLERLRGYQRSLWFGVRDALGSPALKQAAFSKLRAGLAFRFGVAESQAASVAGFALPELFREKSGYRIKPHPDTRRKVVTMQIALPVDDSQQNLGTEFYRLSLNPGHLLREPYGFQVVKQAPFLPNTAYAFSVINALSLKSWHGRTTLSNHSGVRNSILNIWYASAADANPDLIRRHAQEVQPRRQAA